MEKKHGKIRKKKKLKNEKAITLIALVITIIVLLILVGVSIATLTGQNGILTRTNDAKVETRGAAVEEIVELWKTENEMNEYNNSNQSPKSEDELLQDLLDNNQVYEEEIDRASKTITIGNRVINYAIEAELTDIYVALYNDGTLVFSNKDDFDVGKIAEGWNIENIKEIHYDPFYGEPLPWFDYADQITKIEITSKIVPEYTNGWFMDCMNLTNIDLSNLDTSKVTDMSSMFNSCGLTSLDLSSFNTSNVTNMSSMFSGPLSSLDLSSFDTSKVTDMSYMFNRCSELNSLNISSFNTSNVTRMDGMFLNCSGLDSLDLRNFDTSKVTYMTEMFYGCRGLIDLNLSSFNTSEVTSMRTMFNRCSGLSILDLRNFDTRNVQDYSLMFGSVTADVYIGEVNVNLRNRKRGQVRIQK